MSVEFLNAEYKKSRRICPLSNAAQGLATSRGVGGTESTKGGGDQLTSGEEKHWQRNCRRVRIQPRQSNPNLTSKIHTTMKFMEGGHCFDSIGSRNNLLIFQEGMPGSRSMCRTKFPSPRKK